MIFCQKCHSIKTGKCGDPIKKGSVNCTHQNDGFIPHGCLIVVFFKIAKPLPLLHIKGLQPLQQTSLLGLLCPTGLTNLSGTGHDLGAVGHFFLLETMLSEKKRKKKEKVIYV